MDLWFGANAYSTSKGGGKGYYWEVIVDSSVRGTRYKAVFELAVIRAQFGGALGTSRPVGGDNRHPGGACERDNVTLSSISPYHREIETRPASEA